MLVDSSHYGPIGKHNYFQEGRFRGETVMGWIIGIVALSLTMTVLTIAELRQATKTNALSVPAPSLGDRVIGTFVVVTSTVALVSGLTLLAAKVLP